MEKQETQKRPRRACSFRIILRCGIMLVCLILASYVLGVIFKLSGDHGNTFHDFVNQPNSTKVVSEYSSSLPKPPGLNFMEGKSVVVVSHELSLSGGPLLLMELGHILRRSGAFVYWVTGNKKENTSDPVVVFLEEKLLNHGLQVIPARGTRTVSALTTADLVILNTAVAGKWVSSAFKADIKKLLAKTLWWIHEMRGHYFAPEYVKFLPEVAGVITDSHATADYWRTRTRDRLRLALNVSSNKDWLVTEELINLSLYYLARTLYIYFLQAEV